MISKNYMRGPLAAQTRARVTGCGPGGNSHTKPWQPLKATTFRRVETSHLVHLANCVISQLSPMLTEPMPFCLSAAPLLVAFVVLLALSCFLQVWGPPARRRTPYPVSVFCLERRVSPLNRWAASRRGLLDLPRLCPSDPPPAEGHVEGHFTTCSTRLGLCYSARS